MSQGTVTVRFFGALHEIRRQRGLPSADVVSIDEAGATGADIAASLDLPLDLIEGMFCNHTVQPLGHVAMPGDEIAFVPVGTPGPHRFFLGLYDAGREEVGGRHSTDEESD